MTSLAYLQRDHALSRVQGTAFCRSAFFPAATPDALLGFSAQFAYADEAGVSFWLPGQLGSLAAVPATPGGSLGTVYYHTSVTASGSVAASREIEIGRFPASVDVSLNANLNAHGDQLFLTPTYTFATPVFAGQLAIGIVGLFSRADFRVLTHLRHRPIAADVQLARGLFHNQMLRGRYGGRRGRGNGERQPSIPSRRTVGCTEFAISPQAKGALHVSDREAVSDLWTDTENA